MMKPLLLGTLTLGLFVSEPSLALAIDDSSSALNDRFANDPSFIMNDYDLSGIGRASNDTWATLVSRNVFVSANHFRPGINSTVTFYQTNDPTGPSITRQVSSGQRIGTSDIWVGVLDAPVPVGYAVYDIATADINNATDFSNSVYDETAAFMIGQSPTGQFTGTQDVAAGRNVLDSWLDSVNAAGTTDQALRAAIENEGQDVLYEATVVDGDSGAPLFVDFNEADTDYDLQLVGTNWFIQTSNGTPVQNGFTYLGNYDTAIQTIIDSNPIPEPSAIALFGMGALLLASRRRRTA